MKSLIASIVLVATVFAQAELPFNLEAFQKSQKNNEKILLHFHADWCPTCKVQKKHLDQLDKDGILKKITVYSVDFDKEESFKKEMSVTQQSTFLAFYGAVETGRVSGITNLDDIKKFIDTKLSQLSLSEQLQLMKQASSQKVPQEKLAIMTKALDELKASHILKKTLKVGQTMPLFSLPDAHGKTVKLKDLLKSGPVIISFYRGSWCPYCNAQLTSYQQNLSEIKSLGATLVAITPEKPDLTVLTEAGKKLEFPILTDESNKFAKKLGLVFKVDNELKKVYSDFGIDLEKSQGNSEWNLPIPATYIVSKKGKIIYAFVEPDYSLRADPKSLISALKEGH